MEGEVKEVKNCPSVCSAPFYCLYLSALLQQRGWTYGGGGRGGGEGWIACFPSQLSHSVSRLPGGRREGRQTEESTGNVKPDLLPYLLLPSLLHLHHCHLAREPPRVIWSSASETGSTLQERERWRRGGEKEGREEKNGETDRNRAKQKKNEGRQTEQRRERRKEVRLMEKVDKKVRSEEQEEKNLFLPFLHKW